MIFLSRSVLVGDKEGDIQAGIAAGMGLNFLFTKTSPAGENAISIASLIDVIPKMSRTYLKIKIGALNMKIACGGRHYFSGNTHVPASHVFFKQVSIQF